MFGNVWEWCHDWSVRYSSGNVTDSTGATIGSFRVVRGGSWSLDASDCVPQIDLTLLRPIAATT